MKSLAELQAIKAKMAEKVVLREYDESSAVRVVVGMATCLYLTNFWKKYRLKI